MKWDDKDIKRAAVSLSIAEEKNLSPFMLGAMHGISKALNDNKKDQKKDTKKKK